MSVYMSVHLFFLNVYVLVACMHVSFMGLFIRFCYSLGALMGLSVRTRLYRFLLGMYV